MSPTNPETMNPDFFRENEFVYLYLHYKDIYLAHVIEQPNFRIPNPQYLPRNFCFDFFNDSENTF